MSSGGLEDFDVGTLTVILRECEEENQLIEEENQRSREKLMKYMPVEEYADLIKKKEELKKILPKEA